jgi:hypothetical protein
VLAAVIVIALVACSAPFIEVGVKHVGVQVLSKGSPTVKVLVNGQDAVHVPCNGGELLVPGMNGLPPLPWELKVVALNDGRTLFDEPITELPRWLLVQRDSAGLSSSPIAGPVVACPGA